ncbi:MAG: hypothetical protein IPJ32_03995 [Sphingobacteriaceae bacterium]|nr:hypothetical protein [Sphingobacteriaceae bacterium]
MQTQPLTLLLGFVGLVTILENGINKRNIIKVVLLGSIALLPSLFYYIHYGTTNLIKDAGFLDTKFITLNRVSGFYFDFNQGLIITIPIILLMYIPLLISEAVNVLRKKTKLELSLLLPLCIIAISITISTMGNWNHGMAIINRYASWMSCIIMVHVFYLTDKLSDIRSAVLFNYYFMFQFFTTLYHQRINKLDWSQYQHTPLAHWFW